MDETQNDAPFVAFYDMHAVTFVPPERVIIIFPGFRLTRLGQIPSFGLQSYGPL